MSDHRPRTSEVTLDLRRGPWIGWTWQLIYRLGGEREIVAEGSHLFKRGAVAAARDFHRLWLATGES